MHSSMDKPNEEPRPYCQTHKKWFRNWAAAYVHKKKDCVLVTKFKKTR